MENMDKTVLWTEQGVFPLLSRATLKFPKCYRGKQNKNKKVIFPSTEKQMQTCKAKPSRRWEWGQQGSLFAILIYTNNFLFTQGPYSQAH